MISIGHMKLSLLNCTEERGEVAVEDPMQDMARETESLRDEHDDNDDNDNDNDNDYVPRSALCFDYAVLAQDDNLQAIARKVVSNTIDSNTNLQRLYMNTFRHLRKDGVVYLLDDGTDVYLLLSKDRVLLPTTHAFVIAREQWEYQMKIIGLRRNQPYHSPSLPSFMDHVGSAKMRLLKNLIVSQRANK